MAAWTHPAKSPGALHPIYRQTPTLATYIILFSPGKLHEKLTKHKIFLEYFTQMVAAWRFVTSMGVLLRAEG